MEAVGSKDSLRIGVIEQLVETEKGKEFVEKLLKMWKAEDHESKLLGEKIVGLEEENKSLIGQVKESHGGHWISDEQKRIMDGNERRLNEVARERREEKKESDAKVEMMQCDVTRLREERNVLRRKVDELQTEKAVVSPPTGPKAQRGEYRS